MSTAKLSKLFRKALVTENVTVLSERSHQGHQHFELRHPDQRTQKLSLSGSPTVLEHALAAALRDVRKFRSQA